MSKQSMRPYTARNIGLTPKDWDVVEEHGEDGLYAKGFFAILDRFERTREIARTAWNKSADECNQWDSLGGDEKLELMKQASRQAPE